MSRRGVNLIEIMLALGVVAVAILSLMLVFTRGLDYFANSTDTTLAAATGRQLLDEIKQRGASKLPAGNVQWDGRVPDPKNAALDFPPAPYPVFTDGTHKYTLVVRLTDINAGLRSILVDVYWGQRSHITLETYVVTP